MAISWTLNNGVLTISGTGAMDNYDNANNTAPWHGNKQSITSVIIQDGVTSIGSYAFLSHTKLTSVTIPYTVTDIGEWAFYNCTALTNITIPDGVTNINRGAFAFCTALTNVTILDSVINIGFQAFTDCTALTDIYYTNNKENWDTITIDSYNTPLTNATIHYNSIINPTTNGYCGGEGDGTNLSWILDSEGLLIISGTGSMKNYTTDDPSPWNNWDLPARSVIIRNGVTTIGNRAFYKYRNFFEDIIIPNSITSIGEEALDHCISLTDIYYTGSETDWNSITLENAGIDYTFVTIHYNYNSIIASGYCGGEGNGTNLSWVLSDNEILTISGTGAMKDYDGSNPTPWNGNENIITSIIIEDGVTTIGSYAFTETNLTSITFPNSITDIGYVAFSDCPSLTNVTIPNSITNIDYFAFSDCVALTNISVAEDNQYYASDTNGCLYNKNKTELIQYPIGNTRISFSIPNTVTDILSLAFSSCISLTNITIPNSVINIENETFINCTALTDVYYSGNETDWNAITIGTQNDSLLNATIHYDSSSTNSTYLVTKAELTSIANAIRTKVGTTSKYTWPSQMISAIREIPQLDTTDATATPTDILDGKTAYVNGEKITGTASGGSSATEPYCEYTFDTNGNVTAAKLYGFTSIPSGMFRSYLYLENIDISESPNITKIGDFAFYSCTKLILDSLPSGLTSIGQFAFYNCLAVTFTSLPSGLTSIGQSAFYGCKNIELTSLPIGITDIPQQAFDGCTKCAFSYLPSTIKSFGDYAFRKCLGITEIEIAASLKDAFEPSNIFGNNTNLKKVWLRNTCTTIQATSASKAPFAGCSTSLAIYAEPSEKLSGWGTYYNRTGSSGGTEVAVTFNQTTRPW